MYDLIIIGSGPAGLSAALAAAQYGLNYLVIERGVIANTIYQYPLVRPLFSTANEIELRGGALRPEAKPTREEVLAHYANLITQEAIQIHVGEEVREVMPLAESFQVETNRNHYRARVVMVAVGGFGRPRKLNVPGENPERVSYRFSEAHPYATRPVLVVGGGNSAAEAALFLAEANARVTLAIRRDSLHAPPSGSGATIKPWVLEPLERAASESKITILTSAAIEEIHSTSARLRLTHDHTDEMIEAACDHIFALLGADPDVHLLEQAGAAIAADGRPVYSTDYETTVPGLFVAGHVTREMHMKNAIGVGRQVVERIVARVFDEQLSCRV
jgi:thioredoxin reductase (NADPH)